jgi:plastocyanin
VTVLQAARPVLLVGVLCLVCGASAAIAIAVPGHPSRHRPSHTTVACHRARHSRCPPAHAGKKSKRKHKRRTTSKPTKPNSVSKGSGSTTPWATVPQPITPGSTPGSGTSLAGPVSANGPVKSPVPVALARVEVTAEDTEAFRFVLSRPTVPAGKVIIEFVNHGQDEHNLNAIEPTEGSVSGSLPNTAPNAHLSLTLNLSPGSYTLFCSLPSHETKGMKATLVVN